MSDEALRAAERKWRTSGTVEDEAAFLREQVRTGVLLAKRVELAAMLGHRAAELVTGISAVPFDDTFRTALCADVRGDNEAMARVCVAVAIHLMQTMPGEAEHDPRFLPLMRHGHTRLYEACRMITTDCLAVNAAASAAEAFLHAAGITSGDRISYGQFPEGIVRDVAGFFVEYDENSRANTYRAIARGLIPWLLARGDQVREWMSRNTTSM